MFCVVKMQTYLIITVVLNKPLTKNNYCKCDEATFVITKIIYTLACYCSFVGFDCFYNVLICKSLWIKASAK